jgi:uncharacterized damage-inducible protein DinB
MTVGDIRFLYDYTAWANERIFDAVEALTPEEMTRAVGGSFPSIRETLAHTAAADWIWLCRWTGENPSGWPTWAHGPVGEIREEWRRIHTQRLEFIAGLTDADLDRVISFTRINGESDSAPLGFLLQHVVNHATYHRGQVASQLRQVGATPPSTDLLRYRP